MVDSISYDPNPEQHNNSLSNQPKLIDWGKIVSGVVGSLVTALILFGIDLLPNIATIVVPPDAVVAFDLSQCPEGWEQYSLAAGRFLRGIDPAGAIDMPNRPPGDTQADAFQGHTHSLHGVVSKTHGPNNQHPNGYENGGYGLTVASTSGADSDASFGQPRASTETRPANVAVLFCTKT